jgi:predicted nucleic acid-binding protein
MRYVLDASVAFKCAVAEVGTDKALLLRDDFRNGVHELIAPDIFPIEFVHSLTRAERRRRITTAEGSQALLDFLQSLPQLFPAVPLLPRAYAISSRARIGAYDCLYVALAEREGCLFITADDRLVKNLQTQFPFIIPLASLP